MSCVDVTVPSSPLVHGSNQLLDPGQHGVRIQGGSRPPVGLNPLAGNYNPGRINNGIAKQAGNQGRSRGGGGGCGGLSSATNRGGQQISQQPQIPARLASSDAVSTLAAAAAPATESSSDSANGGSSGVGDAGGSNGNGSIITGAGYTSGISRSGGVVGGGVGRGSAAANANHLLNFQYESAAARAGNGKGSSRGNSRPGGNGGFGPSSASRGRYGNTKSQKYDKDKFLQANFRFLVSDAVEVSAYEADADKMFDWDDVLQVEMTATALVQCPISLDSPPLCPQITPCGHVFSFSAIMHHLVNHGGEQLRRSAPCPLCFAPVVARELRLVRVRRVTQPQVGDQLTLALIRRTRTSIIPQPVDPAAAAVAAGYSSGSAATAGAAVYQPVSLFDSNPFAKFVVGSDATELWREAAEQLASCATELVAEGGVDAALEAPYVYGALDQLAARARRWAEHRAECLAARGLLEAREGPGVVPEALGAAAEAVVRKMFTAAVSDVTAAHEAALQSAVLNEQFPSLSARALPTVSASAIRESPGPSPRAKPRTSGNSSGGASFAAAGGIAAAALLASSRGAAEPPRATAPDAQLPFDAIFSEDEVEEMQEAGGGVGPPQQHASGPRLVTPQNSVHSMPLQDSIPPSAVVAADEGGFGPGGAPSLPSTGSEVLGTSPSTRLNTPGTQGEFYTYQAADGSWVFLHTVNLRCLLHAYGSYDSCPPVITARLLELEDVVQADATRRRWRFLSHLPLSGAFKLCEVAMGDLMPPEALTPFADELGAREKRRRRQRTDERRQAAAEAAAAARAAAARLGPSAAELKAMPSLSQALGGNVGASVADCGGGGGLVAAAGAMTAALAREMQLSPSEVAESIALQASLEDAAVAATTGTSPGPSGGGSVSFAHITKMGYAATGPALGTSPPSGSIAAAAAPSGAWGARPSGSAAVGGACASNASGPWGVSAAAAGSGTVGPWGAGKGGATIKAAAAAAVAVVPGSVGKSTSTTAESGAEAAGGGSAKKGKPGKGLLLFSTANPRKY